VTRYGAAAWTCYCTLCIRDCVASDIVGSSEHIQHILDNSKVELGHLMNAVKETLAFEEEICARFSASKGVMYDEDEDGGLELVQRTGGEVVGSGTTALGGDNDDDEEEEETDINPHSAEVCKGESQWYATYQHTNIHTMNAVRCNRQFVSDTCVSNVNKSEHERRAGP
jgi:hypothetical protein